ncbi:MAG: hypothetical protein ABWJ97_07775 [Thermoproteus sp.]
MEVLILVTPLGPPEEVSMYISRALGSCEIYSSSEYIIARTRVGNPSELKRVLDRIRRCRGVLKVEYMVARPSRRRPSADISC